MLITNGLIATLGQDEALIVDGALHVGDESLCGHQVRLPDEGVDDLGEVREPVGSDRAGLPAEQENVSVGRLPAAIW